MEITQVCGMLEDLVAAWSDQDIDKLLSLEPDFTVERFGQVYPLKKASDRRRYMQGLLLAGVPAR